MKSIFYSILIISFCLFSCKTNKRVTPYEYALLSAHVYNDGTKELPEDFESLLRYEEKEKSWGEHIGNFLNGIDVNRVIELSQEDANDELIAYLAIKAVSGGGYYGQAYLDRSSNTLIIAHRGTDNLINTFTEGSGNDKDLGSRLLEMVRDLDDDYEIFSGKIPREQFMEAQKFTKKAKQTYTKQFGEAPKVVHTGHSLGAVLAELCAVSEHGEAITFESPGTAPLIKELEDLTFGAFEYKKFDPKKANITTYNAEPNSINTLHQHIGKVIPLYKSSKKQNAYSDDTLFENIQRHSIDTLLLRFNPKTGKPALD